MVLQALRGTDETNVYRYPYTMARVGMTDE